MRHLVSLIAMTSMLATAIFGPSLPVLAQEMAPTSSAGQMTAVPQTSFRLRPLLNALDQLKADLNLEVVWSEEHSKAQFGNIAVEIVDGDDHDPWAPIVANVAIAKGQTAGTMTVQLNPDDGTIFSVTELTRGNVTRVLAWTVRFDGQSVWLEGLLTIFTGDEEIQLHGAASYAPGGTLSYSPENDPGFDEEAEAMFQDSELPEEAEVCPVVVCVAAVAAVVVVVIIVVVACWIFCWMFWWLADARDQQNVIFNGVERLTLMRSTVPDRRAKGGAVCIPLAV